MKLLYVAGSTFPSLRAHSVQIMKMCAAFSQNGAELTLLARLPISGGAIVEPDAWPAGLAEFYSVLPCFHLARPRRILSQRLLLLNNTRKKHWHVGFTLSALAWIICRRAQFDVVYTRLPLLALYTTRLGIRTVLEAHATKWFLTTDSTASENKNVFEPHSMLPSEDKIVQGTLTKFVQMQARPNFLGIVTISNTLKDLYAKLGFLESKMLVSHDAVDMTRFEPPLEIAQARRIISTKQPDYALETSVDGKQPARGDQIDLPADARVVGYCGHFYAGRGVLELIECATRHPSWIFLLIGGLEQDVAEYRAIVNTRNLHNIRFAGFVPQANLASYLFACDILTMPYMTARQSSPFMSPMKMFEYLAAGRGIVATDWPQIQEVLQHERNALLCARDVDSLDAALSRLMQDKSLYIQLKHEACRDAQQFTWANRALSILQWIEARLCAD